LKEDKSLLAEPLRIVNFLTPNNQMVIVALNYDRTHTQSVQILDTNQGYLTLILLPESIQTIVYNLTLHPYSKN
jgi:hypothetical protein